MKVSYYLYSIFLIYTPLILLGIFVFTKFTNTFSNRINTIARCIITHANWFLCIVPLFLAVVISIILYSWADGIFDWLSHNPRSVLIPACGLYIWFYLYTIFAVKMQKNNTNNFKLIRVIGDLTLPIIIGIFVTYFVAEKIADSNKYITWSVSFWEESEEKDKKEVEVEKLDISLGYCGDDSCNNIIPIVGIKQTNEGNIVSFLVEKNDKYKLNGDYNIIYQIKSKNDKYKQLDIGHIVSEKGIDSIFLSCLKDKK